MTAEEIIEELRLLGTASIKRAISSKLETRATQIKLKIEEPLVILMKLIKFSKTSK